MTAWLAVAAGGALGAVARYGSVRLLAAWLGPGFPYGTLVVNVVGSGLAGWLFVRLLTADAESLRALLLAGFLGAFTTFSAFSVETMRMLEAGSATMATVNVLANVLSCVAAAGAGMALARSLGG